MFCGRAEIEPLAELMETRQASLWHACQLQDLRSYVELGGIPSRRLLEQRRMRFTEFATDAADRSHGVWDKVFLNLDDLGRWFAWGARSTPNAYGPIVFQVHPRILMRTADVAVCLRSAGASDFDREGEALGSVADVDRAYRWPASNWFPWTTAVNFGAELQGAFASTDRPVRAPEVSVTVAGDLLPLDGTVVVWVDPIEAASGRLVDHVRQVLPQHIPVHVRSMSDERREVLADVVRVIAENGLDILRLLVGRRDVCQATRDWAAALHERDLQWLYERYARYLYAGTLAVMTAIEPITPHPRVRIPEDAWWEMRLDPDRASLTA
jgi:hypothetical protein